ncbi:hypothetical protein AB205_0207090 [Aquarana catesbeiana]|uniref:MADF domain-containing protein n=1 Tax=Aquarana catesbeiana TaxID=8400 RepID=A0A2G9Q571_AQUCT|nr:hypothetical protein AB205_0207090 [Aquarana catesbeiana]
MCFFFITEGLIRTRWRSLKDTLQRLQRESKSGSGAPPKHPYAFARYMDFLKPVLELRNTEASWEEEEEEGEEEHAPSVDDGVSFAQIRRIHLWSSRVS